jgi:PH domain/SAM domain (Sterile alpha motif)
VSAEEITASPVEIEGRGETTPQASRRVSASEISTPNLDNMEEGASPVLNHPQRSTSSPLPSSPSLANSIQRTIAQTFGNLKGGESPVMNETLSVIDEHITDLNTPRHSITQESKAVTDSGSEYSSHIGHRLSYINGQETDEEEGGHLTEKDVRGWDHVETARYLRSIGVDGRHCDIFQEQEIAGDVLLEMGQEFLLMKEFDFGVMGRRLKTWHKIKAFQEQVKDIQPQPSGSISSSFFSAEEPERSASRAGQNTTFLPRIPSLSGDKRPSTAIVPRRMSSLLQGSPPTTGNAFAREPITRPSAASIREFNHTRRHSSIDSTSRSPNLSQPGVGHHKKGSFDRGWTMTNGVQPFPSRPGTATEATDEDIILQQNFLEKPDIPENPPRIGITPENFDRGYFSGGEIETRRTRKLLRKRDSAAGSASNSRQSSYIDEHTSNRRHSRLGSTDSIQDSVTRVSAASSVYHHSSVKGRVRSAGSQITDPAPIVTSLDEKISGTPPSFSPFAGRNDMEKTGRSSPLPFATIRNVAPKFRRAVGLRTTSDGTNGVPGNQEPPPLSPVRDFAPFGGLGRTGSTTPSATSKSSERHSTDGSGKAIDGIMPLSRPRLQSKASSKTKKHTSAYMRGLEKKSPQEQMVGCDYSGWMKKRSANLMATWKPRLFVLRGRRLSYYYSENDTEERGLIDITAHRVLRADNDPLTALHATITGAKSSPTSPGGSMKSPTDSPDPTDTKKSSESPFIFKLVPPKSGMSRTVQFTKPTIHYFQVDSIKEGRLWMAALMKATIDRDTSMPVETTNKQKTISLKQARLMNQRPPALMELEPPVVPENKEAEEEEEEAANKPEEEFDDSGLKIQGLNLEKPAAGAEVPQEDDGLAKEVGNIEPEPAVPAPPAESLS